MEPSGPPGEHRIDSMLRLLADQAGEHAILLLDTTGRLIWSNSGGQGVLGLQQSAAPGMHISAIFTPEDREDGIDRLEQMIASCNGVAEDDRWQLRADGSRFWASGAMIPLRAANGELIGFGKILRDRTALKEQMEFARNQVTDLQRQNDSKDAAITKISHELRNVFAGITTGLHLLHQRTDPEWVARVATLMQQQLDVMQRLNEDLLEAKRLAADKVALSLQEVEIQAVTQRVCDQMHQRCQEKSLRLELLAPAGPLRVIADPVRLHQILANLIDNAIKYTPAGGNIWVKCTREDPEAVIHIEDTGKGIPADMLTAIFELFTQVEAKASTQGLGVGLALVQELVHLHGGSVQAASKGPGQGSQFTVRLPLPLSAVTTTKPGND